MLNLKLLDLFHFVIKDSAKFRQKCTFEQNITKVNKIDTVGVCSVVHFMIYVFILKKFSSEPHWATPGKNFVALCTFRYG